MQQPKALGDFLASNNPNPPRVSWLFSPFVALIGPKSLKLSIKRSNLNSRCVIFRLEFVLWLIMTMRIVHIEFGVIAHMYMRCTLNIPYDFVWVDHHRDQIAPIQQLICLFWKSRRNFKCSVSSYLAVFFASECLTSTNWWIAFKLSGGI